MPPKSQSGAGMQQQQQQQPPPPPPPQQQQGGHPGPNMGGPPQQHYFHQYDPNVDGPGQMGGPNMPLPHRHHQYQQQPPMNAGGGKRGGGGGQQQQQQQQQGYGGGPQDYPPYGGGGGPMYYGGGGGSDYNPPPHSGNSSAAPSATRRNAGSPGGNNNSGGNYGGPNSNSNPNMHHHQHHNVYNNNQPMGPMQPPPQQGGPYGGGAPLPPGTGSNNNSYAMDQGSSYGGREGSGRYGDASGVASPNPAPGGNYMGPPPQGGQRRGGYGGGGNNNSGNMNQSPQQQQQQQPPQRYSGGGGNNMYRGSPYPAPSTPHQQQSGPPPQQPPLSMPPPQQGGGPNSGSGGWQQPPPSGMMPPPPIQGQLQQQGPLMPPMPMQQGGGGANYGYGTTNNNSAPPPPPQQQQGMYQGPPSDVPPGTYGGGYEGMPPHGGMGGPLYNSGPYGANNYNAYDGPAPGMPSVMSPPPDMPNMMAGGGAPPMNMRSASALPPPPGSQPPMGTPGAYPQPGPGGMVPSPGRPGSSMPPQEFRNTPMAASAAGMLAMPMMDMQMERQKDLYMFLHERRLLKKKDLRDFFPADYDAKRQGPRSIAVDGNFLLSNLRNRMCRTVDPLWFLHSSLPDCLTALVNTEVQRMRQRNLEPVWVFQGIGISGDVEAFLPSFEELRKRDEVWQTLMEGAFPMQNDITEAFDTSATMGEDVIMAVQRFLRSELNVLTVTAPFSHWCQMCTLHHEGDVQLLYGHPEMLMVPYGPMQLIVEIDFDSGTVAYFDREDVLNNLFPAYVVDGDSTSASDRLLDLALLVATQPVVTAARASTQCTIDTIYQELSSTNPRFSSLTDFINANEESQTEGRRGSESLKHSKGRAYMQYSAVFTRQFKETPLTYFCRVLDPTLDDSNTPGNLSGVFGNLLPLCLFFFQYTGLLSVSFMTIITQSYFRDELPVSDSVDYQECLPKLVALRGQIVFQIVLKLQNEAYRQRLERLSWVRWFEKILLVVQRPPSTITLDEWRLAEPVPPRATPAKGKARAAAIAAAAAAAEQDDPENVTVATVLNTSGTCIPQSDVQPTETLYHGRNQTMQAILLKSLDFLGYYSHKPPPDALEDGGVDGGEGAPYSPDGDAPASGTGANEGEPGMSVDPSDGNHFTVYLCRSLSECDAEFQSALVRFTELLRVEVLNAAPSRYVPVPIEGNEEMSEVAPNLEVDEAPVRLASRIACLVTVPYLEEGGTLASQDDDTPVMALDDNHVFKWAPVYSRSLCAFSIMVRAMNRDLRELVEVITASLFLQGHSDCTLEEFTSFTPLLPFGDVPSAIGGLLLHYVLVFPDDYDDDCTTVKARCQVLHERFSAIRDIATQLRRVMEFTFQALFLLNAYIAYDDEQVRSADLTAELVHDTLDLLAHKWRLHLTDPVPVDVHRLWPSA